MRSLLMFEFSRIYSIHSTQTRHTPIQMHWIVNLACKFTFVESPTELRHSQAANVMKPLTNDEQVRADKQLSLNVKMEQISSKYIDPFNFEE